MIDKAADVAAGYVEKKENVVNLLKQQEGVASNQVMLRVRFAEVSRSAMQELGAPLHRSTATRATGSRARRRSSSRRRTSTAEHSTGGKLTFSDFLNIFLFNTKHNVGAVVTRAAEQRGCSRAWPSRT